MQCFMCFSSDGNLQMIETDLDNDTLKRIKFVLPDFLIPESMDPVFICSTCLEQVSFFHTIKKTSLQNCSRLKHFNAVLKGTDNFKCNELRVILNSDKGSAQRKHQIKFKVNPNSKYLLSSEDQDAPHIKEEDETYEIHYQHFVNDEPSLNHLQDDTSNCSNDNSTQLVNDESSSASLETGGSSSDYLEEGESSSDSLLDDESSSSSDDNTIKHKNLQVNKLTKKDSNLTSSDSIYEDQSKTQNESRKKRFKCSDCHKEFNYRSHLERHRRVHIGEKPYKCITCQKTFKRLDHLNVHKLTHTGEKPHECDVCHKTFNHKSNLLTHKRIHNNVRPHKCAVCFKRFTTSSDLTRHMLTHTGEKPHQCHLCEYKCAQSGDLKRHIRRHTGEKPYSCKHCDKSFTTTSGLKIHECRLHRNEVSD